MRQGSIVRRQRHSDVVIYIVSVLWLIGFSQRTIAGIINLRPKQVAGIIELSGYVGRADMTDAARQSELTSLEAVRIDGGRLDGIAFKVRPLGGRQSRGPIRRKMRHG